MLHTAGQAPSFLVSTTGMSIRLHSAPPSLTMKPASRPTHQLRPERPLPMERGDVRGGGARAATHSAWRGSDDVLHPRARAPLSAACTSARRLRFHVHLRALRASDARASAQQRSPGTARGPHSALRRAPPTRAYGPGRATEARAMMPCLARSSSRLP